MPTMSARFTVLSAIGNLLGSMRRLLRRALVWACEASRGRVATRVGCSWTGPAALTSTQVLTGIALRRRGILGGFPLVPDGRCLEILQKADGSAHQRTL